MGKFVEAFDNYKHVGDIFGTYWKCYGGISAILTSPYCHASIILGVAFLGYWSCSVGWASDVLQVIPSIIGFSLGAYAIFLAFSDKDFVSLLAESDDSEDIETKSESENAYLRINAQFVHFILVQVIAVLFAISAKYLVDPATCGNLQVVFSGIGFWFFMYALLTAVATTFSLLRLARLYRKFKDASGS